MTFIPSSIMSDSMKSLEKQQPIPDGIYLPSIAITDSQKDISVILPIDAVTDQDEVTHEVFFGENIKRVISALKGNE